MGFDAHISEIAVSVYGNNLESAMEFILQQQQSIKPDPMKNQVILYT